MLWLTDSTLANSDPFHISSYRANSASDHSEWNQTRISTPGLTDAQLCLWCSYVFVTAGYQSSDLNFLYSECTRDCLLFRARLIWDKEKQILRFLIMAVTLQSSSSHTQPWPLQQTMQIKRFTIARDCGKGHLKNNDDRTDREENKSWGANGGGGKEPS